MSGGVQVPSHTQGARREIHSLTHTLAAEGRPPRVTGGGLGGFTGLQSPLSPQDPPDVPEAVLGPTPP